MFPQTLQWLKEEEKASWSLLTYQKTRNTWSAWSTQVYMLTLEILAYVLDHCSPFSFPTWSGNETGLWHSRHEHEAAMANAYSEPLAKIWWNFSCISHLVENWCCVSLLAICKFTQLHTPPFCLISQARLSCAGRESGQIPIRLWCSILSSRAPMK